MLNSNRSGAIRVFAVWQPVLPTDWGDPSPALTSLIPDRRAIHFWDRDRRLSSLLGGPDRLDTLARFKKVGFQMKDVIWDAAFVYPAGAAWGAPANLLVAPVVKYADVLATVLAQ